jgi:multiple sugar transport system substrate-binding protein
VVDGLGNPERRRHIGTRHTGALEAAKLYKSLIDEGLTEPGVTSLNREDVQNLFKQGKVGMMITAPFLSNQIKEEAPNLQYGVAAIPAGPTARAAPTASPTRSSCSRTPRTRTGLEAPRLPVHHPEQRAKFTQGEGFLPVNKEEPPRWTTM